MNHWRKKLLEFFDVNIQEYSLYLENNIKSIPMLYQYYPISVWSLCNLMNTEIYLSEPSGFNDPFDSLLVLSRDEIIDGLLNIPMNPWISAIYGMENKDVVLSAKNKNDALNDLSLKGYKDAINILDSLNSIYNQMSLEGSKYRNYLGVSCFTEKNNNPLMWGHYAKGGTGFCVCYDFSKIDTLYKRLFPIIYSKKPYYSYEFLETAYQVMQFEKDEHKDVNVNPLYKTSVVKPKEWTYENEWRLLVTKKEIKSIFNNKRLIDVSGCIKRIILGPLISDYAKRVLKKIAADIGVDIYYAKINPDKFKYQITR